jgi:site-specific recombinase XerD
MLICGDVIRPGLAWMLTRTHRHLAATMAQTRDPDGFDRLRQLAEADPTGSGPDALIAATRIATLLACKGGTIAEITVGDCVELVDTQRRVHARGGQKKVDFYLRLRALGIFPPDAPATIRAFGLALGQLSIEELADRYRLRCAPVRDLIVDYLRERQPSLDFASLDAVSRTLAGLFWAEIETLAPGLDSLRLSPEIAHQWKENLRTKKRMITNSDGARIEITSPRLNAKEELMRVRAFYLDIAQWAVEEPARWGPWAVPCPISDAEIGRAKERKHRKSRMDQRTRERLPVLPVLVSTANQRRLTAARRLHAAVATAPGALIADTDGTLRRAVLRTAKTSGRHIWAEEIRAGRRRNLSYEEDEAFWAHAAIEVLRLTGIRGEELLELTHLSITEYRLPSTGELVPLLQIAPSKTDIERLLLISPELADVLSGVISRLRAPNGAIPLVAAYDVREKVWNPPMPLLFQRSVGSAHRAITSTALRQLLLNALAATGLTDAAGDPLIFVPHDFRRVFVTDAIMNGLPPHIAQVICGHRDISTTLGYEAIYPTEAIEPTAPSSPAAGQADPATNTEPPPTKSGTPSSPTSRSGRCPSAPALAPTERPASMSTLVSDAHSYERTRPNGNDWKRSATTSTPASPKPNANAGSARSKDCKSASPAPRTSSHRSTPPSGGEPAPLSSACPRSPISPAAPPHRADLSNRTHRDE